MVVKVEMDLLFHQDFYLIEFLNSSKIFWVVFLLLVHMRHTGHILVLVDLVTQEDQEQMLLDLVVVDLEN